MKNSLWPIIKIMVSGSLLYLIFLKIDLSQFTVPMGEGNILYLSSGLAAGIIFNVIKFLKWHQLIRTRNKLFSYPDAAKSYMIGNSLGLVTPLRAGDLGRALYFLKDDRPRIMGLTIVDRLMDLTAVFVLSIAGSFYLVNKGLGILLSFLALSCFILLYSHELLWKASRRLIPTGAFWDKLRKLMDMLKNLNKKTVSTALMLSLAAFILAICQFYFLISSFEATAFAPVCLVTPLIMLSSIMPVSFMGLGVREGLSILLFGVFGISGPTALSAAFLAFVVNNVLISIIGIYFLSSATSHHKKKVSPAGLSDEQGKN